MNETLTFNVSELLTQPLGSTESYDFLGPVELESLKVISDIKGTVEIMRLEDGINVNSNNIELTVEQQCNRCLEQSEQVIKLEHAERVYLLEADEEIDDPNDQFLVDKENLEIDLTEMLRQEIILHFPPILVCSKSCKGICAKCGKNRNKEQCKCQDDKPEANKPLAILKDLIK